MIILDGLDQEMSTMKITMVSSSNHFKFSIAYVRIADQFCIGDRNEINLFFKRFFSPGQILWTSVYDYRTF